MLLSDDYIKGLCLPQDFQRGKAYYREGRVGSFAVSYDENVMKVQCSVSGSRNYRVCLSFKKSAVVATCECPRYRDGYYCKHIAAAMLAYIDREKQTGSRVTKTAPAASMLLRSYLERDSAEQPSEPYRLEPCVFLNYSGYPMLRFFVGQQRMYAVQNLEEFALSVRTKRTVSYGKGLSFCHAIENFDEDSRELIHILLNELSKFRTREFKGSSYNYSPLGYNKRFIQLEGDSFDRVFDLMLGQTLTLDSSKERIRFEERDPDVSVQLREAKGGAKLSVEQSGHAYFGDSFHLYAASSKEILRCSQEFRDRLFPLVSARDSELSFSEGDIPTLCDCVLSQLEGLASIDDPAGIMERNMPDDCSACYYFDVDPLLGLTGKLKYMYGEQCISEDSTEKYPGVKRNVKRERELRRPLEQRFSYDAQSGSFYISDEDEAIDFLIDGISEFQSSGEVYVSETLRSKRINTAKTAAVGVSVSGGMLTLELESGEFPPEELEALYESLLKRKRFHKLRDGRYLALDGSGYEKLAEIAHVAQLDTRALSSGAVSMPAYRALYLDRVLGKCEDLLVRRNDAFRKLARDFKAPEDSEFQPPAELEPLLRPYQRLGFQWMKLLEANGFGGILADEMGLGKTVQVLAFLLTATRAEKGLPSLVVCPASLILNWADEISKFAPSLSFMTLIGNAAERGGLIEADQTADVWITSYDLLKRDLSMYEGKRFYCCVLDEGQNIKNQSTLASKSVKRIKCAQRFVLTGTPIENRLSELWNLFDFLMPGYLFSHTAFVQRLEKPIAQSGNAAAQRQLSLLVQPFMLRRLKSDVLRELPPKIEHVRRIALEEGERRVYQAAAHEALSIAEQTQEKLQILALLTRLRQICCDPALCFENYSGSSSKLDACLELCQSMVTNGHQILLFSQFTSMLDRIRERLGKAGISSFTIEGATPKEKRARLVKAFNAGEASVFLISLKAGGTGLNLTGADVVIHYDPWWNLAAQNQATDRAHRIGQERHVHIYKLIAENTIEEKILRLQEKKAALMEAATVEAGTPPLTRDEILSLLS